MSVDMANTSSSYPSSAEDAAEIMFPGLSKKPWIEVNLNTEFLRRNARSPLDMKDPVQQQIMLDGLSQNGTVRTYGGLDEDRSDMWNGVIDGEIGYRHLGVDFNNLTPGDKVASITDGKVVLSCVDKSPRNGWGGRTIIKGTDGYYHLYGHMDHLERKVGDAVQIGDIIGDVGSHDTNGGWFVHIHYQTFTENMVRVWSLENVDGYGQVRERRTFHIDDPSLL